MSSKLLLMFMYFTLLIGDTHGSLAYPLRVAILSSGNSIQLTARANQIAVYLERILLESGQFAVLERERIDALILESNLQNSNLFEKRASDMVFNNLKPDILLNIHVKHCTKSRLHEESKGILAGYLHMPSEQAVDIEIDIQIIDRNRGINNRYSSIKQQLVLGNQLDDVAYDNASKSVAINICRRLFSDYGVDLRSHQPIILEHYKSPFIAGLFSTFIPGTGQMYINRHERGMYYLLAEAIFLGFGISMMLNPDKYEDNAALWGIALTGVGVLIHLDNVYDAIAGAKNRNHVFKF